MKPTELRLGNWINTIEGPAQVREITDYERLAVGRDKRVVDLQTADPIPLTEEILLKAGFTHKGGYFWQCKEMGRRRFIANHLTKGYFELDTGGQHLQFVHQLQNLSFALTDQELEINL